MKEIKKEESKSSQEENFEKIRKEVKSTYGNVVAFKLSDGNKDRYFVFRPLNAGEFRHFKNRLVGAVQKPGEFDFSGLEADVITQCCILKDDLDYLINHKPGLMGKASSKIMELAGFSEEIDFLD